LYTDLPSDLLWTTVINSVTSSSQGIGVPGLVKSNKGMPTLKLKLKLKMTKEDG
jgi:hypothetical protein